MYCFSCYTMKLQDIWLMFIFRHKQFGVFFSFFFFFGLIFFRAAPAASHGSFQARGWIRAAAASLRQSHSHSHTRSKSHYVTYTIAHSNAWSLSHWARPGIKPSSSWIPVRLTTAEPQQELWNKHFWLPSMSHGLDGHKYLKRFIEKWLDRVSPLGT